MLTNKEIRKIVRKHYSPDKWTVHVVTDLKRIRELRESQDISTWGQGMFHGTNLYRLSAVLPTPMSRGLVTVCEAELFHQAMAKEV